jgi:hypothetical protein
MMKKSEVACGYKTKILFKLPLIRTRVLLLLFRLLTTNTTKVRKRFYITKKNIYFFLYKIYIIFEWLANKDYLSDEVDIIQKEFEQFKKK